MRCKTGLAVASGIVGKTTAPLRAEVRSHSKNFRGSKSALDIKICRLPDYRSPAPEFMPDEIADLDDLRGHVPLFDLLSDRRQAHNFRDERPEVVAHINRLYAEWRHGWRGGPNKITIEGRRGTPI